MTGPWPLVEQIHKDPFSSTIRCLLPVLVALVRAVLGRGASVLDPVLVPSEELVLPLDDELAGHLLNSPVRRGQLIRAEEQIQVVLVGQK